MDAAFSLNMPNNYFNIWDSGKQGTCLVAAEIRIEDISRAVNKRESIVDVHTTPLSAPMNPVISRKYNEIVEDTSGFYVTDQCIGCGLCEKVCNAHTIQLVDERPTWHGNCTKCFTCIHLCSQKAVQFIERFAGHVMNTEDYGRYINPNVKISELMVKNPGGDML